MSTRSRPATRADRRTVAAGRVPHWAGMTTWFTADLHLGHRNIIDYTGRPFEDVGSMNRGLIDRWTRVVDADDTVWVLGDVAMGPIRHTLPLVGELPGHKLLVPGNHDRCWPGHGRAADPWVDRYLDAGFDAVCDETTTVDIGGEEILLCHFPYEGDSHDEDRYVEHRPIDDGRWLLHGHVHTTWAQRGRMINVGVDVTDQRPVSEAEIAALIADGPAHRSTLV